MRISKFIVLILISVFLFSAVDLCGASCLVETESNHCESNHCESNQCDSNHGESNHCEFVCSCCVNTAVTQEFDINIFLFTESTISPFNIMSHQEPFLARLERPPKA